MEPQHHPACHVSEGSVLPCDCGLDELREKAKWYDTHWEAYHALRKDNERLLGALNQIFLVCSRGGNMDLREIKSIVDAARAETSDQSGGGEKP